MKRNNRFIKKNHFDEVIDVIINNINGDGVIASNHQVLAITPRLNQ